MRFVTLLFFSHKLTLESTASLCNDPKEFGLNSIYGEASTQLHKLGGPSAGHELGGLMWWKWWSEEDKRRVRWGQWRRDDVWIADRKRKGPCWIRVRYIAKEAFAMSWQGWCRGPASTGFMTRHTLWICVDESADRPDTPLIFTSSYHLHFFCAHKASLTFTDHYPILFVLCRMFKSKQVDMEKMNVCSFKAKWFGMADRDMGSWSLVSKIACRLSRQYIEEKLVGNGEDKISWLSNYCLTIYAVWQNS